MCDSDSSYGHTQTSFVITVGSWPPTVTPMLAHVTTVTVISSKVKIYSLVCLRENSKLFNCRWYYRILYLRIGLSLETCNNCEASCTWGFAQRDLKLSFQREIHPLVKDHNIPDSLVINHDQTPLTYVSVSSNTLAPEGAKFIGVRGTKYKRQITGNFDVMFSG